MVFDNLQDNIQDLQEKTTKFVDSNMAYYKLWFFKVCMKSTTMLLKILLIAILMIMVLIFFSIAAALAVGYALDNFVYGFLIIGAVYLLLSIIIYYTKDKIVEGPILERFSELFFNDED